jgi:large subunit ribosomal protein L29
MPRRIEKIRESSGDELRVQERELTEQIFRLRFQLSTGQAEALKRLRDARKDLARVKTHLREQELDGNAGSANGKQKSAEQSEKAAAAAPKSSAAKTATAKPAKKKSAESSSKTKKAGKA